MKMAEIKFDNMVTWNGLPAFYIEENNGNNLVIFASINNKMNVIKLKEDQVDNEDNYRILLEKGLTLDKEDDTDNEEFNAILSLTEKCNCRCKYCFLDAENVGIDMTDELMESSIKFAFEKAGKRRILFSAFGGEPTVNRVGIENMVKFVKEYAKIYGNKYRFSITTNGIMSDETLNTIIENNFKVSLSMDGIKDVQNYHRPMAGGGESFDKVIRAVKILRENNINIKMRSTVTKHSVKEMVKAVKLMNELDINKIQFAPVTQGGRGENLEPKLMPPSAEEFSNNLIEAIKCGKKLGVTVICYSYSSILSGYKSYCNGKINNRIVISPSGIVSTCVEMQSSDHSLYDAFGVGKYNNDSRSFDISDNERKCLVSDIFDRDKWEKFQKDCKSCPLKMFCGGGCPSRNYRGTGSTEIVDEYRCEIIKRTLPFILSEAYSYAYKI